MYKIKIMVINFRPWAYRNLVKYKAGYIRTIKPNNKN